MNPLLIVFKRFEFAKTQEAYDLAVTELFESLDILEERLGRSRNLTNRRGDDLPFTWLDLHLFMTLVCFDSVFYVTFFKTNQKRIVDYSNLLGFIDVHSMEPIKKSINMDHIKTSYFTSHPVHDTFGIIPVYDGPDLDVPHGRDRRY